MKLKLLSCALTATVLVAGCGTSSSKKSARASAASAATGVFASGPDMATPRGQHTATVLTDGRVLVTGGTDGMAVIADAEIFDPLTTTWSIVRQLNQNPNAGLMMDPTGSFPTARQLHSASLLPDGRVLIAGGVGIERLDASQVPVLETLRTAYIFDPRTNSFSMVGSLTTPRAYHQATVVGGGRVVLAGGLDSNLNSLATADVFDPLTNTFTQVPMSGPHTWGSMVSIGQDAMLVGGAAVSQGAQGWNVFGVPASRVEGFSAATGGFAAMNSNIGDRVNMASTSLANGAFFAGGQAVEGTALTAVNTTEFYDAATGSFVRGPDLTYARFGALIAPVGGELVVMGGVGPSGQQLTTCEVYNPALNQITRRVNMLLPRSDFRAVTLQDGRVLVIGGMDAQAVPRAISQTEFFGG